MSPRSNAHANHASDTNQPPQGCAGEAGSTADMLKNHLMGKARNRTILKAVAGGRFCAVMLDDGGVGLANLCPDVCGQPSRRVSCSLPQPGSSATDALATLSSPELSAVGLATANALANRFAGEAKAFHGSSACHDSERWEQASIGSDLLEVLELKPDDHVGMVGCFSPMVKGIRQRVQRLSIFERGPRLTSDLLPEGRAAEVLPECSVALITATTIINGTIDDLLLATQNCREVVLLGPSTPLVPEVFVASSGRVTLLAGVVVTSAEELLRTVIRDGGTRDFKNSVAKVNIRVNTVSKG